MPISINSDSGNIFAGGNGVDGDAELRAIDGAEDAVVAADTGGSPWDRHRVRGYSSSRVRAARFTAILCRRRGHGRPFLLSLSGGSFMARTSSLTSALVVALLLLPPASRAGAQLSTASTTQGQIDGTSVGCGPGSVNFTTGVTANCDVTDAMLNRVQASARADAGGRLRGLAVATSTGVAGNTIATAGVSWTERIAYSALTRPVSLRFGFGFSGFETSSMVPTGSGAPAASVITFIRLGVRREGSPLASAFDELLVRRTYSDFGTFTNRSTEIQQIARGVTGPFSSTPGYGAPPTFLIDLDIGSEFTDFSWGFALNAIIAPGASGTIGGFYFNTATINDLALVDASGRDVSAEFGLRFESGASYSVVPEPSAFVLLALGLMLVVLVHHRRGAAVD